MFCISKSSTSICTHRQSRFIEIVMNQDEVHCRAHKTDTDDDVTEMLNCVSEASGG